jgi:hypothetical protein
MSVSSDRVNTWAKAISESEEEKCSNTIRAVSDLMKERFGNSVRIIHQGSHRNRTNVRADSDVDIAVAYQDAYFSDVDAMPLADQQRYWQTLSGSSYSYEQFKDDVHTALREKFGLIPTTRKSKCIRVEGNTYRVSADVVPAFVSKRFNASGGVAHDGIGFIADTGGTLIHSFPEQHYASGVRKNDDVGHYKAAVRVLKNARNEMMENGIVGRDSMPSFFLECLVWNAPHSCFQNTSYKGDARAVAAHIWNDMRNLGPAQGYREVSELKWLLREAHRTPTQAEAFMLAAWNYLE